MSFCAQAVPLSTLRAHRDTEPPQSPAGQTDGEEYDREPAGPAGVLLRPGPTRRVRPNLRHFLFRRAATPQFECRSFMEAFAGTEERVLAQGGLGVTAHGVFSGGSISVGAVGEAQAGWRTHTPLPERSPGREQTVRACAANRRAPDPGLPPKRPRCLSAALPVPLLGLNAVREFRPRSLHLAELLIHGRSPDFSHWVATRQYSPRPGRWAP